MPSTIAMPSGKWYAEFTLGAVGGAYPLVGLIATTTNAASTNYLGGVASTYGYGSDGQKYNSVPSAYGASFTAGDIIAIAFDATAGSLTFYKNNVSQGVAFSGLTGSYFMAVDALNAGFWNGNFGQRPFTYTPPTGFVALNTFNLPTSTIVKGNTVMDATLYTGNGGTQSMVNAAGFYPDLTWIKSRSAATYNAWYDSNRGVTKQIISDYLGANETTQATGLTAFNSNGFTVGSLAALNTNAATYVAWQFNAGAGTNTTNTAGSITSTVSVNASAGFSIVKLTPPASTATVGHGLGVAPSFILTAPRQENYNYWFAYLSGLGATKYIDMSDGFVDTYPLWNDTAPTSSVFSIDSGLFNNFSTDWVAYCWAEIPGYSAFRVIPNVTTDTFVYLGFRPKFLMYKRGTAAGFWFIKDSSRSPFNVATADLYYNGPDAETNFSSADFVSNGFVARSSVGTDTMVLAFAENPFKNSLAR
jgi:hypothetical protein